MEAVLMNTNGDYRHRIGNPKRNFVANRTLFPYPSDDLLWASSLAGGHFAGGSLLSLPPSSLSHSYPPAVSVFRHPSLQPPLLPLPISTPINHQNMNIYRSNSTPNNNIRSSPPRINKNVKNRGRDHSLTPKKSKNQKKNTKREVGDLVPPAVMAVKAEKRVTESSIDQIIGPDPSDLPMNILPRVSLDVDKFSGSVVFTPSPPPSSLPLPTFSLRPKLSCNRQAAGVASGVDAGATDSLRQLLRL